MHCSMEWVAGSMVGYSSILALTLCTLDPREHSFKQHLEAVHS